MIIKVIAVLLSVTVLCAVPCAGAETDTAILADYIYRICKNSDYITMLYVGSTAVNRLENPAFPDSMAQVVKSMPEFNTVYGDLIYGIFNASDDAQVRKCCVRAAYEALNGCKPAGDILYFCKSDDREAFKNRKPVAVSDGLTFYE